MTTEQLLELSKSEEYSKLKTVVVDAENRKLIFQNDELLLGVESDELVERVVFLCPRVVGDGKDLTTFQIRIIYRNANRNLDYDICTDTVLFDTDGYIRFSWEVSRKATSHKGITHFIMCAFTMDENGVIKNEWNTTLAKGTILEGLETRDFDSQPEEETGLIEQLLSLEAKVEMLSHDVEQLKGSGGGTGGAVNVDSELSETSTNPVQNKVVTKELGRLSNEIANLGGSLIEPSEADIPKVFFDEAMPQTKTDTVTAFRYISKTKDISGYAEFKAQGNSSMSYPKKNETVKMYADEALEEKLKIDFKGWGEQRKHVYKANWIDLSHARNVVSARLWADVVKSRADYLSLPELLRTSPNQGAVDGFPVKVYSQGIYQGRYTLNIPKDAWMANMDDSLDEHCILCGENYASGCFRATANINGSDWTDEVHDTVPTSIKTRWNEVIDFVMNSTDDEFKTNLENYFFVDSLIDYFIFGMVSCGLDAFGKNQLYFTYDGVKWIASMYDMDSTWGLYWNGSKFVSASYSREEYEDFVSTSSSGDGNLLYIRLASLFYEEIQARYAELKQGALSVPNIINRFERFTDIAPLDLVQEDYASTTGSGKFTGIPSQSTNNIQQIRQFVIDRYAYCDTYFANLGEIGGDTVLTLNAEIKGVDSASGNVTENEARIFTQKANVEPGTVLTLSCENGYYIKAFGYSSDGTYLGKDGVCGNLSSATATATLPSNCNFIRVLLKKTDNSAFTLVELVNTTLIINGIEYKLTSDEPDNPEITLTSISATYSGGDVTVGTDVNSLTGITVTATYSDGTMANVTGYTLSGEIGEGENTITVSYNGLTTTFTVTGIELDGEVLYKNHSPNGNAFSTDVSIDFINGDYIEAKIDATSCTNSTMNTIFSIGNSISAWLGTNIHLCYKSTTKELEVDAIYKAGGNNMVRKTLTLDETIFMVRVDANGIAINNEYLSDYTISGNAANCATADELHDLIMSNVASLTTVQVGCSEGTVRLPATYNYIRVVRVSDSSGE